MRSLTDPDICGILLLQDAQTEFNSRRKLMDLQIGKNIKTLRTRRGITQETLAARLGVAPQSVSKWERGEGYPDITFLIPLADYFGVPLDTLMGRNEEEREQKIADILRQYEHFRHIGNHNVKKSLIRKAYEEFPFDFRIIVKYVESLICSDDPSAHRGEIERLCTYVIDECTADEPRWDAITTLISLYSECGEYDLAAEYANRLPALFASREFALTGIYPNGDERDFTAMANFIDTAMERILWQMYCIAVQRQGLTDAERIDILERTLAVADAVFPDFDCDVCHSGLADVCLALFRLYSEAEQDDTALDSLERAFRHDRAIDEIDNEEIMHTSPLLRGNRYDMRKVWDGCKCNGVWFRLERLSKPPFRFERYENDPRYQEILGKYRPFAVEDKTK
jgi:transcriptional regulator with XRE-family HTH domain